MKKLLIVEDEKMIRQGIQAMVMRSPVFVEEIILCKNGDEAYEIVKNQKIDAMITDIRMPKMDGITLVKKIQALPYLPKVIVISGYDDFSYVVELLRFGAKEYLLKPIDRDAINKILIAIDKEIEVENDNEYKIGKIGRQQYKYMLLNTNITETEVSAIEKQFNQSFLHGDYVVCCTNYKTMIEINLDQVIYLDDINGQSIFIVMSSYKEELLSNILKDYCVGVSSNHKTIGELREAYQEALYARKSAFATGNYISEYNHTEGKKETISEDTLDQLIQMVGTDKLEEANKLLHHILYKTKQGLIEPDYYSATMYSIVEKLCVNYKNLLVSDEEKVCQLKNVYEYDNAGSYNEALLNWIESINEKSITEYECYKNKQKIQSAIEYIHENYNKDLSMAVVSNHVSMNYSLFSYVFKHCVGMNFVSYMKEIRIKEAKKLLEETDLKILEISYMVGYENEKHFMKTFKSVCGVSPSEFRKNAQIGKKNIMY